jgi:hypothetical protein
LQQPWLEYAPHLTFHPKYAIMKPQANHLCA